MSTHLYTKVTSIYIITKKEVLGTGWRTADLKQLHEVIKLTVNVSAN